MRDPRDGFRLLPRDLAAGRWIGEGYEVAQYQLHEAVFPGKSAVVVSRFVRRWKERGLIIVERWNRIGMNRLRLTAKGRDLILLSGAAKPEDLFVPKRPVAPKDLAHRLWVNDLRVVLDRLPMKPEIILAHWAIERRFVPRWPAIPDLLAVWTPPEERKTVLAVEVDLGGEPLKSVFAPKLRVLEEFLSVYARDLQGGIVVLTSGTRRRDSILTACHAATRQTPFAVQILPDGVGREALQGLEEVFMPAVQSSPLPETKNTVMSQELTADQI